jgi:predicted N-acetyltransferase YhbS
LLITLSPLADARPAAIEQLLDAAFGADRRSRTAYRLRADTKPIPDLSFAALEDDLLVGSLQSWPIALRDQQQRTPLILVGPVAVRPDRQLRGVGRMLMEAMLARASGREPLVLIGDPEYYGRHFGFSAEATSGWSLPGPFEPRRLLVRRSGGDDLPRHGMLEPRGATNDGILR